MARTFGNEIEELGHPGKYTAVKNIAGLNIKYCGKVLEALLIDSPPSR